MVSSGNGDGGCYHLYREGSSMFDEGTIVVTAIVVEDIKGWIDHHENKTHLLMLLSLSIFFRSDFAIL